MNLNRTGRFNPVFFFIALIVFCSLPVWCFQYYVNQDGSPHLYNAQILLEILRDNSSFSSIYEINPYPIPNLSGHWIIAFLLLVFPPFVASKLMISLTFAGVVAACGWLRFQTSGRDGIGISLLIGCVVAFNWLWFLGFYNFILGLAGFAFTLGLFWRWRERLTYTRTVILSVLIVFVYFSHLISFGMLFGSIFLVSITAISKMRKRNRLLALASFVPTFPLLISYRFLSEKGGAISPTWNNLHDIFSVSDWVLHLQAADPLQLISRKAFPFFAFDSAAFAAFSSLFWIFIVFAAAAAATLYYRGESKFIFKEKLPWVILVVMSVIFWLLAPDDFGKSHGSYLRERVLLCGLICFIPLYEIEGVRWMKRAASVLLSAIVIFQTAVLWEYSANTEKIAQSYMAAKEHIGDDDKLASVVFVQNSCRYKANPLSNLNPLLGIGKNTRIWDNYELGYYLFPVVVKDKDDQILIFDFRKANVLDLCDKNENVEEKLRKLKTLFDTHHQKITVLLIWNRDQRVDPVINNWFELEPFFSNGNLGLYRHRTTF